jgi:hypothetical protein
VRVYAVRDHARARACVCVQTAIYAIIGGGGGALLVIILIVVGVCVSRRRSSSEVRVLKWIVFA